MKGIESKLHELSKSLAKTRTRAREKSKRLDEVRKILDAAFNALQEGILIIDSEMNALVLNRYMRELFQIEEDIYGKKCHQVIQGSLIPCRATSCRKVLMTGKGLEEELVLLIKGEKRIFEVRTYPWSLERGPKGVIRTFTDITHRRAVEELSVLTGMSKYMAHAVRNALLPVGGFLKLLLSELKGNESLNSYYKMVAESLSELEEAVDEYTDFIRTRGEEACYSFDAMEILLSLPHKLKEDEARKIRLEKLLEWASISFHIQPGSFIKFGNEKIFLNGLLYLIKGALQACKEFCEGKGELHLRTTILKHKLQLEAILKGAEVPDPVLVTMYRPWEGYGVEPAFHHWGIAIFNEVARKHGGNLVVKREMGSTLFIASFPKDADAPQ